MVGPKFYGRVTTDRTIPLEDIKNYLLAISNFGKGTQDYINLYITRHRLNNASFRQKLDPIAKNIFRRQKSLELVFKVIWTFDAQNPIIGSLLKELGLDKKDTDSTLIKKALSTADVEIQSRLNALKNNPTFLNSYNNCNKSNINNLPPSPPMPPPPPPSFEPQLPPHLFNLHNLQHLDKYYNRHQSIFCHYQLFKICQEQQQEQNMVNLWLINKKKNLMKKSKRSTEKNRQCIKQNPWATKTWTWQSFIEYFINKGWWCFKN